MTIRFDTVVYRFNGKRIDKATFERLRAVGGMIQETKESKSGLQKITELWTAGAYKHRDKAIYQNPDK